MKKGISSKTLLLNLLVLVACISVFPLIGLFGNGDIFSIYVLVLVVLAVYSFLVYFQKRKGKSVSSPTVAPDMPPVAEDVSSALPVAQQQPDRKLAVLQALATVSGIIEAIVIVVTIMLISDPALMSIAIMVVLTAPVCVVNGIILVGLVMACVSQRKKSGKDVGGPVA